ncbi:PEP-CTERM sorting domain-containing protein [Aquabacterium sp. OR-4]|uniref:PEP-CTERM sorting domain-containing protein n=1 Tax=Aquabacterium sp. OR-4 TaxID=2978127 RepID=UPI0021B1738C|nr:PEP-CTERM sorting domain-containing protein [Aquabacterium sp. OR-4]MDT7834332.1 PEP-CTERM sorting domain-containing protein [Aquabacterium sp. OR-4]
MARQTWIRGVAAGALALAAQAALAVPQVISAAQLMLVAPDSGQAQFDTADGWLRVSEQITATMTGSELFGFEGLWLGSGGDSGHYSLSSQRALAWLSLDLIALSAVAGEGTETLAGFAADAPGNLSVSSADGSASLVANSLVPTEEDGRATLTFTAMGSDGFNVFYFHHDQPVPLQGFVLQQIRFETVSPVPEPASAALWLLGAAALAGRRWRGRQALPTPPGAGGSGAQSVSVGAGRS